MQCGSVIFFRDAQANAAVLQLSNGCFNDIIEFL
jgi:hypothetical protein